MHTRVGIDILINTGVNADVYQYQWYLEQALLALLCVITSGKIMQADRSKPIMLEYCEKLYGDLHR